MPSKTPKTAVAIPADVPASQRKQYTDNYLQATHGKDRLMLFAGDQKIEHLNDDYYGEGISEDNGEPEHMFRVAAGATIGVFATQLGLIARYGRDYKDVPYLVKLNSKTNLVKTAQRDPFSPHLVTVEQVAAFRRQSRLRILGVGATIYLGSEFEAQMLRDTAQMVLAAHHHGFITVLWIYPRGRAVADEKDPHLIAGATGVAATLGSDFVKVNYPKKSGVESSTAFKEAVRAAGRCRVVCAGGSSTDVGEFLQRLHDQIHVSGASGNATGRNIHQKSLAEAVRMCDAISAITLFGKGVPTAMAIYRGEKRL